MSPIQWAVRPLTKYADFTGRAPRTEYWWFYLATLVAGFLFELADKFAGDVGALSIIFNLAVLVPWIAVTVRRLHDTNRRGWWLVALAVPLVVAGAIAGFLDTTAALDANFGGQGSDLSGSSSSMGIPLIIGIIALVILSIVLFVFLVLPGTEGPNRYGPDPYGPDGAQEAFA
jgi:uncharacterized membrane protein YhaH (DUF805 family)